MLVTLSGISYAPEMPPGQQTNDVLSLLKSTPFSSLEKIKLFGLTHIPDRLSQRENARL